MISSILFTLSNGWRYVKRHPHILLSLLLLIFVPLVFLYTGQQFLEAGRANQDSLYRERVGFLHDTLSIVVTLTKGDDKLLTDEVQKLTENNSDISVVAVFEARGNNVESIYTSDQKLLERLEEIEPLLRSSAVHDSTLIFPVRVRDNRLWQAARVVETNSNFTYFIYTEHDLSSIDELLKTREQNAYASLLFIYAVMLLVVYWQIRSTDYRYLYQETKQANEMKDLFTNMIAHELRAPLTAIRGYASMLEESSKLSGTDKEHTNRIKTSSERLLTIVNDLLDVARIQSGKLTVELTSVNVSETVLAVRDELESMANEKKVKLVCEDFEAEHLAMVDSKRLHQALVNLVSNAIKYTEQGTIAIAIEEKSKEIELRIKDTGKGIAAEDQRKLFAPFFRVQSDDVSEITGTGLGMWITKRLINLMGGKVAVESIKGVGTHVVVTLSKS